MKQSQPRSLNQVFQRLLFVRLMLPLLLLGLLTTVVMGYTLGRQLENQQLGQARSLNHTVDAYLENADRVLKAIARVTESSGTDELVRYMQATQQAYEYFDTLYCLDEAGRIVALAPVDLRYQGVDMSLQPYFQQAGEQTGITISSPFISLRTGQPTVWVGRSLRDGGLVVGELNLGALQEAIVARLEQPGSETIFVTDRFGTLLAHPRSELVAQQTNVGDLYIVQRGRIGEASMLYRIDTTLLLGSVVQMERTGWIVVVQTPFFVTYLPYFGLTGGFFLLVLLVVLALMNRLRRILD
ncbi:MAG: cache domain-containing protein, partial [Anaerolineae bacterium]